MALEGIQQYGMQNLQRANNNKNISIPQELEMKGVVKDVARGGLAAFVAVGLNEIRKNLEAKLRGTTRKVSKKLLSLLGIEGEESGEEPGGLETVKKGLKEIWKNLQMKMANDEQ